MYFCAAHHESWKYKQERGRSCTNCGGNHPDLVDTFLRENGHKDPGPNGQVERVLEIEEIRKPRVQMEEKYNLE